MDDNSGVTEEVTEVEVEWERIVPIKARKRKMEELTRKKDMAADKEKMHWELMDVAISWHVGVVAEFEEAERELDAHTKDTEETDRIRGLCMEYTIPSCDPDPLWEGEAMRRKFVRRGRSPSPRRHGLLCGRRSPVVGRFGVGLTG